MGDENEMQNSNFDNESNNEKFKLTKLQTERFSKALIILTLQQVFYYCNNHFFTSQ